MPTSPRKAATSPEYDLSPVIQGDYYGRGTSLPVDIPKAPIEMPKITSRQTVLVAGSPPTSRPSRALYRKQLLRELFFQCLPCCCTLIAVRSTLCLSIY